MPASMQVYIEGGWGEETIVWNTDELVFDLPRFHYDQHYADIVDRHIRQAMVNLSEELAAIAVHTPTIDW